MKYFENSIIKPFLFIVFGICILGLRRQLLSPNKCHINCNNIKNEMDFLNCLDSCATNASELVNVNPPIPAYRIYTYGFIVIAGFLISTYYIDQICIKKKKTSIEKLSNLYLLITKKVFKVEQLNNRKENDEFGYIRLDEKE